MNLDDFERAIVGGIPFTEAAAYLIKIKTAAPMPPPDETGELEGQFSIPTEQVVALLGELVKNEFETIYAYHVYSQSLRDLSHDAIAAHFEEHADDELDHADFLMKRMAVLAGPVQVPDVTAPSPSADALEIVRTMVRMEQEGIVGWKRLLAVVGDNPMRVKAEEYMAKEQEHLDDLWQLLPHQENMPIIGQGGTAEGMAPPGPVGGEGPPPEVQQKAASARFRKMAEILGLEEPISSEMGEPTRPFAEKVSADRMRAQRRITKTAAVPSEALIAQHQSDVIPQTRKESVEGLDESYPPPSIPDGKYPWGVTQSLDLGPKAKLSSAFALMRKLAAGPDINQYMAREQMMAGAQEANELEYYRQQAQQAAAAIQAKESETAQLQEQMQMTQQQVQQMQGELDQSGQMQRQILDQARAVEQQAAQTAAAAHQAASASTLQAMQASQEVLRHKQMTAQLQQSVQAWKDGLMSAAAADPTATAGQQVGMPMSGPMPQPLTPAPNAEVPTDAGAMQPSALNQAGQAEAPAASPSPEGAEQPKAKTEPMEPEKDTKPATKQGSAWAYYRMLSGMKKQATATQRMIGGAVGAGLGALGGYGTSKAELGDPRIQELEGQKARGENSFAQNMQLAVKKFKQDVLQIAHDNPKGAMLGGAGLFGLMGAGSAPAIAEQVGNIPQLARDISRMSAQAKRLK